MAIAVSFVMSLVEAIARLGFAPNLAAAWLTSFAIGAAGAIPTAILVAPGDWPATSPARRATRRRATASKPVPESEVRHKEAPDPPAPGQQGLNSLVLTARRDAPRGGS